MTGVSKVEVAYVEETIGLLPEPPASTLREALARETTFDPSAHPLWNAEDAREGRIARLAQTAETLRSIYAPACEDCGKELSDDDLASTAPNLCDSCEQQRRFDEVST